MSLTLVRDGATARIRIDRAAKRNALTHAMWTELAELVAEASDVRLLVLEAAEPGSFCAGADIGEFAELTGDPAWRVANQAAIRAAMDALASAAMPTVALIDGDCIGGGCGLALCCDLRLASPRARFGITPAKLGLVYSLDDTRRLVTAVGVDQAKRILFTGGLIDAAEAARIGLVTLVAEDLATAGEALIASLLAASPHSQRESKAMIARITAGQQSDDEATRALFAAAFDGPDFREGSAAFAQRRKPEFEQ